MARVVLVADDSPTIQKKALGILKGEGFEVETVSNGVAAIKRLAVLHPVVILADVSMPGRDGYEVCDYVKKSAELSRVPVLLVASDMEPYDDARGAEVRADGIIKKPFEAQDLIAIVVKFAQQFEASTPAISAPVVPPSAPAPVPEFAVQDETPEETPTVVQPVTPDFSAASEGLAFAEPVQEETPAYSPEPVPAESYATEPAPVESYPVEPALVEGYSPEPAPVEGYPAEPTLEEGYPPEPVPAEGYSPEPAPVESYPAEPAPAEGYSAEPAPAESYSAEPTPAESYSAEPAPAESYPAEPAPEEGYSPEPVPEEREVAYAVEPTTDPGLVLEHPPVSEYADTTPAPEPESVPAMGTPLAVEEPSAQTVEEPAAPSPAAPPRPSPMTGSMSFLEGLVAAHEPVFIEETSAPAPVPPSAAEEIRTMIFRAPLEIAEPVWKDETVPAPPAPEPAGAMGLQPQHEAEAPAAPEVPAEPPPQPQHARPGMTATSLDSFSLEDATAGQVHFASHSPEVAARESAPSAPAEEAVAAEVAPSGPAPEPAEAAPPETAQEAAPLEAPAEGAVPAPAMDWGLIYSVVHKVVVKMSPPALPMEAVEEMARRLADEIATEISNEMSQPPAE